MQGAFRPHQQPCWFDIGGPKVHLCKSHGLQLRKVLQECCMLRKLPHRPGPMTGNSRLLDPTKIFRLLHCCKLAGVIELPAKSFVGEVPQNVSNLCLLPPRFGAPCKAPWTKKAPQGVRAPIIRPHCPAKGWAWRSQNDCIVCTQIDLLQDPLLDLRCSEVHPLWTLDVHFMDLHSHVKPCRLPSKTVCNWILSLQPCEYIQHPQDPPMLGCILLSARSALCIGLSPLRITLKQRMLTKAYTAQVFEAAFLLLALLVWGVVAETNWVPIWGVRSTPLHGSHTTFLCLPLARLALALVVLVRISRRRSRRRTFCMQGQWCDEVPLLDCRVLPWLPKCCGERCSLSCPLCRLLSNGPLICKHQRPRRWGYSATLLIPRVEAIHILPKDVVFVVREGFCIVTLELRPVGVAQGHHLICMLHNREPPPHDLRIGRLWDYRGSSTNCEMPFVVPLRKQRVRLHLISRNNFCEPFSPVVIVLHLLQALLHILLCWRSLIILFANNPVQGWPHCLPFWIGDRLDKLFCVQLGLHLCILLAPHRCVAPRTHYGSNLDPLFKTCSCIKANVVLEHANEVISILRYRCKLLHSCHPYMGEHRLCVLPNLILSKQESQVCSTPPQCSSLLIRGEGNRRHPFLILLLAAGTVESLPVTSKVGSTPSGATTHTLPGQVRPTRLPSS